MTVLGPGLPPGTMIGPGGGLVHMAPQGQVMQLVNTVNGPMLVPEGQQPMGQVHQFQHMPMDGKSPPKSSLQEPPKLMIPTMQNQHLNPILMSPGKKFSFA